MDPQIFNTSITKTTIELDNKNKVMVIKPTVKLTTKVINEVVNTVCKETGKTGAQVAEYDIQRR